MDELVGLVMKKTGLPKETAQAAVKVVLDFLKKKLPATGGCHHRRLPERQRPGRCS
jgi:nucleoid DNA-binding protein